jgi:zona occludens toxin (predicted ATPase)
MITIITGVPGMGKTAQLVHMLLKNEELGFNARPVFAMGINGLVLDHVKCPPVEEWTEQKPDPDDPKLYLDYFTFPPNSIIVIDEAQRIYRPRATSTKIPPYVSAFETHRHTGVDFILLTQKPHQMDKHVLGLAGRHIHIKNTILGRKLFEWSEFKNVDLNANLDTAIRRSYKPPKEVFKLYKSADLHTKQPKRFHQIWVYLGIAVIALTFFGYKITSRISEKLITPEIATHEQSKPLQTTQDTITVSDKIQDIKEEFIPTHPFQDFTFTIVASIKSKSKSIFYYELTSNDSKFTMSSIELEDAGYKITYLNDCANFMLYNGAKIVATCNQSSVSNPSHSTSDALKGIIKG